MDRVRQKLPREGQREIQSLKKLQHDISVERIIREVAKVGNSQSEALLDRKTKLKDLRQMAKKERGVRSLILTKMEILCL